MTDEKPSPLTYASSGVNIATADRAKEAIKRLARSTFTSGVVGDIGSFGGLFRPDLGRLAKPLLVASSDGVGTKLKIAFITGIHDTVGVDLVSHCTNDILVQGAIPLFFMDYIATGRLEPSVVEQIVAGLASGCRESGCALLGGETAEMPDFYGVGEYDLAGFIVGAVDQDRLLGVGRVEKGDLLIGLSSSGLHTNGYSLARKVLFEAAGLSVDTYLTELGRSVGEELLAPHRNYLPTLGPLLESSGLHAMAHVTGGGIPGNLNRALPPHCDALVRSEAWEPPAIFHLIQKLGRVEREEMFRVFNMGVGLILIVSATTVDGWLANLEQAGQSAVLIGEVVGGEGKVRVA